MVYEYYYQFFLLEVYFSLEYYGPMQWKQYVLNQMLTPNPTAIPVPSDDLNHLVWLESMIASHRNLRGIMVYFVLLSLILSLFEFNSLLPNLIVHFLLLLLSLSGVGCVIAIYRIEAIFRGMPNPAFPKKKKLEKSKLSNGKVATPTLKKHHFSVIHSPSFFFMIIEITIWLIHSPTGRLEDKWENWITSLMFLRVYVVVIYLSERCSSRLYSRSINATLGVPCSFTLRAQQSQYSEKWIMGSLICIAFLLLTALYRRVEGISWLDACNFCASTVLFLSFGKVTPTAAVGRFIAFFLWILGLMVLAWITHLWVEYLTLSESERGIYGILKVYRSRNRIAIEAAKSIQRAWKLYLFKKRESSRILVHCCAILLTRQCLKFRETRRHAKLFTPRVHMKRFLDERHRKMVGSSHFDEHSFREYPRSPTHFTQQHEGTKGLNDSQERFRIVENELDHLIYQLQEIIKRDEK